MFFLFLWEISRILHEYRYKASRLIIRETTRYTLFTIIFIVFRQIMLKPGINISIVSHIRYSF